MVARQTKTSQQNVGKKSVKFNNKNVVITQEIRAPLRNSSISLMVVAEEAAIYLTLSSLPASKFFVSLVRLFIIPNIFVTFFASSPFNSKSIDFHTPIFVSQKTTLLIFLKKLNNYFNF